MIFCVLKFISENRTVSGAQDRSVHDQNMLVNGMEKKGKKKQKQEECRPSWDLTAYIC